MEFNGTFFATIITFLVFVFLMNKILYAPILNIMEERKEFIDANYKSAEENDSKTSELEAEKDEKLTSAREEAKGKYLEAVGEFKSEGADVVASAQDAAREDIEASKFELENVSNEVKNSLKGSMVNLATDIVEKVIGSRTELQDIDEDIVNKVLWENK